MSVLPILTWPDQRLSQPCAPCTADTPVATLARDMLETMYAAPGRGLAAPQVGHMLRMFVMDTTWKTGTPTPQVFVNPRIKWASSDTKTNDEGCLSIPGVTTSITRPAEIDVDWQDADGIAFSARFTGFAAACIQHEIDHLDGLVTFDRLPDADRASAVADFKASL